MNKNVLTLILTASCLSFAFQAHADDRAQKRKPDCETAVALNLGKKDLTKSVSSRIGEISASCGVAKSCQRDCRGTASACKRNVDLTDCKKSCKKAGKRKASCLKACKQVIDKDKTFCRGGAKACLKRCRASEFKTKCKAARQGLMASLRDADLSKAKRQNIAKACGKAGVGRDKKKSSAKKDEKKSGTKKGRKKVTAADVDQAIAKAKEVMESECGQEVKEHASGVFAGIKKARKACKALRTCKKTCRKSNKSGRKSVRTSKRACKKKCKGLKRKDKRQCVKRCRTTSKSQKRQKRGSKKSCMTTCRKKFKTPACTSARGNIISSLFKAVTSLAGNDVCQGYVKEAHDALKKSDKAEGPGDAQATPQKTRKPRKRSR